MRKKIPQGTLRASIGALVCLTLLGCINVEDLRHPSRSMQYYSLEYPAPSPLFAEPSNAVLRLKRFEPLDAFATDRIVYEKAPFSPDSSYYDRWAVSPASMVTGSVLRDLTASGLFRAVVTAPGNLLPDYELAGTVESLQARQGEKGWESEIIIHVLFYPFSSGGPRTPPAKIFHKRYVITTPCQDLQALSVVKSMSAGMEKFSNEMLLDLAGQMRSGHGQSHNTAQTRD